VTAATSSMIYPTDIEALRAALLDAFDRQRQVDIAALLVARLSQFASRFPLDCVAKVAKQPL
jgi:hypothetical protein